MPIVELAENVIRLQGKRPGVDIQIEYTGPRPGEKLHESVVGETETVRETTLAGVRILEAHPNGQTRRLLESVTELAQAAITEPAPALEAP